MSHVSGQTADGTGRDTDYGHTMQTSPSHQRITVELPKSPAVKSTPNTKAMTYIILEVVKVRAGGDLEGVALPRLLLVQLHDPDLAAESALGALARMQGRDKDKHAWLTPKHTRGSLNGWFLTLLGSLTMALALLNPSSLA